MLETVLCLKGTTDRRLTLPSVSEDAGWNPSADTGESFGKT